MINQVLKVFLSVFYMWSYTIKLNEEIPNYVGLGYESDFDSTYLLALSWLVKNMATMCTCRKECNRYDLTIVKCFWLAHHKDASRWFAIISPPPICYPNFSFMGGVAKKCITKLGCEKCFCRVTYWTPSEMLLLMDYKSIVNFCQFFIWQLIILYIVNLCKR